IDPSAADFGAQIVRAYLSSQHLADVENSCPMVALPSDVSRSDAPVKRAFENVFKAMVDLLERSIHRKDETGDGSDRHRTAQASAAVCVGGMVVARSMEDRALAAQLLTAGKSVALELGGWSDTVSAAAGKRLGRVLRGRVRRDKAEPG